MSIEQPTENVPDEALSEFPRQNNEDVTEAAEHTLAAEYKLLKEFAATNKGIEDQEIVSEFFGYALSSKEVAISKSNYETLVAMGLNDSDSEVQYVATLLASRLPSGDYTELITKGLQSNEPGVRKNMLGAISNTSKDKRADFIMQGLVDKDADVRMSGVFQIQHIPDAQTRLELVKKAFDDEDWGVRYAGEFAVDCLPEEERVGFFVKAFENGDAISRLGVLEKSVRIVPVQYIAPLIELGLHDPVPNISMQAASMIKLVPNKREQLRLRRLNPHKTLLNKILDF